MKLKTILLVCVSVATTSAWADGTATKSDLPVTILEKNMSSQLILDMSTTDGKGDLLGPVDGKVFIHIITVRIPNNLSTGFTHKYIFPHGRYWNYDAVPSHNRDLKTINRWYMNGINYHKTSMAWLQRFDNAQESIKSLDYGMDYVKFRRIWRFYILLLGTIFATCDGEYNGNGQYLMVHA